MEQLPRVLPRAAAGAVPCGCEAAVYGRSALQALYLLTVPNYDHHVSLILSKIQANVIEIELVEVEIFASHGACEGAGGTKPGC